MRKKFDPEHAATHGYTRADWISVDAPELSEDELAQGRPFAEAFPELAQKMRRAGRPPLKRPNVAIWIRLDQDVVAAFKKQGPGRQCRMNAALRAAAHLLPERDPI